MREAPLDRQEFDQRLSRISTLWTLVLQAHTGPEKAATSAQSQLLQRYGGAVYRYLLGAVRDPEVAEDLCQEFAYRFARGDFHRATPQRGRFRDYLRTALIHLVTDYYRARQAWPGQFALEAGEPAAPPEPSVTSDRDFLESWREELLDRTWQALEAVNAAYHAVLRLRVGEPDLTSAQMAERLSEALGKTVDSTWVRKNLQRSHTKFADLLLIEVAASLEGGTEEQLQDELASLDLLRYCRAALSRRGRA